MARKVKETPVLRGKDAVRFEKAIKENAGKRVSAENYARARDAFHRIEMK